MTENIKQLLQQKFPLIADEIIGAVMAECSASDGNFNLQAVIEMLDSLMVPAIAQTAHLSDAEFPLLPSTVSLQPSNANKRLSEDQQFVQRCFPELAIDEIKEALHQNSDDVDATIDYVLALQVRDNAPDTGMSNNNNNNNKRKKYLPLDVNFKLGTESVTAPSSILTSSLLATNHGIETSTALRLRAGLMAAQRNEAYGKAAKVYNKGKHGSAVAGYYADIGHQINAKMHATNMFAAEQAVREQSVPAMNRIDLHNCQVKEALLIVEQELAAWYLREAGDARRAMAARHPLHLVTGRGQRSKHGVAKVMPAVEKLLQRGGWRYQQDAQTGEFIVSGKLQ